MGLAIGIASIRVLQLSPILGLIIPNSIYYSFSLSLFLISPSEPNRVLEALDILYNTSIDLLRSYRTELLAAI